MKANAHWPATPEERRDRDLVVKLVRTVGEQKVVWTVYDVRRLMQSTPRLMLTHTGQLSRHIHALDRELVTPVSKRLDSGLPRDGGKPSRARHQFVLTHRLSEYDAGATSLDDLERVYCALWVACESLGVEAVRTRDVTNVLQNVEALALVTQRNTQNHLVTLHARNRQLAAKEKRGRWSLWRPLGPRPEHPDFDRWVRHFRKVTDNGANLPRVGHATLNSIAHELVTRALRLSRSSTWPAGHSVQIADIRAAVARDKRAAELAEHLRLRGRTVGSVLGDLTKERIAGRRRVERPVIKVGSVQGGAAYYDAPDEPGFDRRRLIVPYRTLQAELAANTLRQLDVEARSADRLRTDADSPVARAIGTARLVHVHRELRPAGALLDKLEEDSHLLGKKLRKGLNEYRGKFIDFLSRIPTLEEITEEAEQALAEVGLDLTTILAVDRPLMTPHDYVSYLSPTVVGHLTPSEFLHRVKTLRRLPNPEFTRQNDPDALRAARYCVDRPEALCYLAERYQGRVYSFLRAGLQILGRDLRSPALFRLLACDEGSPYRRAGLAALVLLDDEAAAPIAKEWLRESARPEEIADAIEALLVLGQIEHTDWPKRIRNSQNYVIRNALTNAVLAARTGRRLLQR